MQKAKKILTSTPNPEQNIYSLLTGNDFYKEGKKKAKQIAKKEQRQCMMMTYGFLSAIEIATNQAPDKNTLKSNPVYCLGYLDAAQNGNGFIIDMCSETMCKNKTDAKAGCSEKCYAKMKKEAIKNSSEFANSAKAGTLADPVQVMSCGVNLMNTLNNETPMKKTFISIWPKLKDM